jgi:hypothetical protein
MPQHQDDRRREREQEDLPGPAEETEGGTSGNTEERSSENRRRGLEKDRERARDPEDVGGEG